MNWKAYGMKRSCHNLNVYPSVCLVGLRQITKTFKVVGFTKTKTKNKLNPRQCVRKIRENEYLIIFATNSLEK